MRDDKVKIVIIRGMPSDKNRVPFCAGGDIRAIYNSRDTLKSSYIADFYAEEYRLNTFIHNYEKPYISLIDGIVMGGGVGVSIHGSHRIMSERALFAMPETSIGLFPDVGSTYFLPKLPGSTGMYLGLTGARIGAADSLYLGIATHYVASNMIDELTQTLVDSEFNGDAVNQCENILEHYSSNPGSAPIIEHIEEINRCFTVSSIEEIFEKLKSENTAWSKNILDNLLAKSPTSLKVTFRQLSQLTELDFESSMKMEYRMAMRFSLSHDLYEGIRAVIIDKDFSPNWIPSTIQEVDNNLTDEYFKSPENGDLSFD
tara:strand:- start:871 stop:1815 length:945 start_codon:yes stop_codon:yes gene_type:complete